MTVRVMIDEGHSLMAWEVYLQGVSRMHIDTTMRRLGRERHGVKKVSLCHDWTDVSSNESSLVKRRVKQVFCVVNIFDITWLVSERSMRLPLCGASAPTRHPQQFTASGSTCMFETNDSDQHYCRNHKHARPNPDAKVA
jgi:hypothetical protein